MSRLFFSLAFALGCTAPVFAEDKPKPNALTPKEIAEGWLLLYDGETTFGWNVEGDAKVKDGKLVIGGEKKTILTPTTRFFAGDLMMESEGVGELHINGQSHTYAIGPKPTKFELQLRVTPGTNSSSSKKPISTDSPVICEYKLDFSGPTSMHFEIPASGIFTVKSMKFKPHGTKPLFNGKNLDGWKVTQTDPKRTATKFEVTPTGELSAKNGPGDLQTEKQFDDFVLQFECKTNGLALNSGIFFRCMPDAYQNGYEAQIQNAYLGDRTKPIDYGTGAIYRRIAARKVVSNDNEWFTMTVAARGAHIATWVNGYQTVDWTDDRKANENPRQGLRTAKGHLSIQGHDPTTDLLFRNIRIAELPKP